MSWVEALFRGTAVFYGATCIAYVLWFREGKESAGRRASRTLAVTLIVHTVALVGLALQRGVAPPVSQGESLSLLAYVAGAIYLYIETRAQERGMGVLASVLLFTFAAVGASLGPGRTVADVLRDGWFAPHAIAVIASFASFTIGAFMSLAYLVQYRQLRGKSPGLLMERLPPLQVLDSMTRRVTRLGFFFLTIGLVVGMVLAQRVWGEAWSWDPKQCMTLLTWLLYGLALLVRRRRAWQGGRIAVTNLAAFASVIFGMFVIYALFETAHRFG